MACSFIGCVLLVVAAFTKSSGIPTTCHFSPIQEGNTAFITCELQRGLLELKDYTFFVSHYVNEISDPAQVLVCRRRWGRQCLMNEGYRFHLNETHLQLVITNASAKHNSHYDVTVVSGMKATPLNGKGSTCSAPVVRKDTEAYVTCNFSRNINNLTTYTVSVEHFPEGEEVPESVLMCTHIGILQCFEAAGYSFDYRIDNSLRLKIPEVSRQHAGRYACEVLSPALEETEYSDFCTLQVEESSFSIWMKREVQIGIGAAGGALLLGFGLGVIVGVVCQRKKCCQNNTDDGNEPEGDKGEKSKIPRRLSLQDTETRVDIEANDDEEEQKSPTLQSLLGVSPKKSINE